MATVVRRDRDGTGQSDLAKIGRESDGGKVDTTVDDLDRAVADYDEAVLNGESPDSTEIDKAAGELNGFCTS